MTKKECMIGKIRALMAKTEAAGCTEAEAKAAAAMVDRLLEQYEIDLTEVELREQRIVLARMPGGSGPVAWASTQIGTFTDCKVWTMGEPGRKEIWYLGLEVDVEIASYLTAVFHRACEREGKAFTLFNPAFDAAAPVPDWRRRPRGRPAPKPELSREQREMIRSFEIGMAVRLGERVGDLKWRRDLGQKTSGRDLMVVKTPMIEEAFARLGIQLSAGTWRGPEDMDAARAGREAANAVAINQAVRDRAERSRARAIAA